MGGPLRSGGNAQAPLPIRRVAFDHLQLAGIS